MKSNLFLFLMVIAIAIAIFFNSCENCPTCLNGGECVSGSCDCPPGYTGDICGETIDLTVTRITINSIPFINPGTNSDWDDALNGYVPDLYFVIRINGNDDYTYSTPEIDVDMGDLPLEFNLSYPVTDLDAKLTVAVFDEDGLLDEDDFIGQVEFTISDYTSGNDAYPNNAQKQSQNVSIKLNFEWNS